MADAEQLGEGAAVHLLAASSRVRPDAPRDGFDRHVDVEIGIDPARGGLAARKRQRLQAVRALDASLDGVIERRGRDRMPVAATVEMTEQSAHRVRMVTGEQVL